MKTKIILIHQNEIPSPQPSRRARNWSGQRVQWALQSTHSLLQVHSTLIGKVEGGLVGSKGGSVVVKERLDVMECGKHFQGSDFTRVYVKQGGNSFSTCQARL